MSALLEHLHYGDVWPLRLVYTSTERPQVPLGQTQVVVPQGMTTKQFSDALRATLHAPYRLHSIHVLAEHPPEQVGLVPFPISDDEVLKDLLSRYSDTLQDVAPVIIQVDGASEARTVERMFLPGPVRVKAQQTRPESTTPKEDPRVLMLDRLCSDHRSERERVRALYDHVVPVVPNALLEKLLDPNIQQWRTESLHLLFKEVKVTSSSDATVHLRMPNDTSVEEDTVSFVLVYPGGAHTACVCKVPIGTTIGALQAFVRERVRVAALLILLHGMTRDVERGDVSDAPGADVRHTSALRALGHKEPVVQVRSFRLQPNEPARNGAQLYDDALVAQPRAHGTLYLYVVPDEAYEQTVRDTPDALKHGDRTYRAVVRMFYERAMESALQTLHMAEQLYYVCAVPQQMRAMLVVQMARYRTLEAVVQALRESNIDTLVEVANMLALLLAVVDNVRQPSLSVPPPIKQDTGASKVQEETWRAWLTSLVPSTVRDVDWAWWGNFLVTIGVPSAVLAYAAWSNYAGVADILRLLTSYARAAGSTLKELGGGVVSGDLRVLSDFLYEVLMLVLRSPYQIYFVQLYLTTLLPLFKADKTLSVVEKLLRVYSFINYFARIQALTRLSGVSGDIGMDVLVTTVLSSFRDLPTLQDLASATEQQFKDASVPREALEEALSEAQRARATIQQPDVSTMGVRAAFKQSNAITRTERKRRPVSSAPKLSLQAGDIPTPDEHARLLRHRMG